jgi:Uma2 family endonuclease
MAIARRRVTLEQFLALDEQEPALEYIHGVVTQKMSPKYRHRLLQLQLATLANLFAVPRRLARATPETRTTFAGASVVPDMVVFTWDRIPVDEHGEAPDDIFEPPDVAIEIASPGQSLRDLIDRCRWYVGNSVRVALLVDPSRRAVHVFRADGETGPLHGAERVEFGDMIPGLSFSVDELFSALRPR